MAVKVDYVVKETATNLRRNITLTLATMVTIALTLTMVGTVKLINQGLERSAARFRGNVEFIVFMQPQASTDQIEATGQALRESPQVRDIRYLDHDDAFAEFKSLFADQPDLVNNITAEVLPTNYKVQVRDGRSDVVESLVGQFINQPGVYDVISAGEKLKQQEESFGTVRAGLYVGVAAVGIVALVLIINSIRTAMYARRREIEVMKLVGATNWFIRLPFMVEGMIQGIFGAGVGILMVWAVKAKLLPALEEGGGVFEGFRLTDGDVWGTSSILVVAGIFVGMAGSAFAVSRYLDV